MNPGDHVADRGAHLPRRAPGLHALPGRASSRCRWTTRACGSTASEDALRARPKFLYVLPNFQNPAGYDPVPGPAAPPGRARQPLRTPIVEDDPYGQLRYEGKHLPAARQDSTPSSTAAPTASSSFRGGVLYLGTLSKMLAPRAARRLDRGAPEEVIAKLVQLKQGADLHTSTFAQMVAHETARGGFLDRHVRRIRRGLRRAPRRHARRARAPLPAGRTLDAARGRALPVGDPARGRSTPPALLADALARKGGFRRRARRSRPQAAARRPSG